MERFAGIADNEAAMSVITQGELKSGLARKPLATRREHVAGHEQCSRIRASAGANDRKLGGALKSGNEAAGLLALLARADRVIE